MDTPINWRKSSYSGSTNDCVEIADLADGGRAVRDSKNPDDGFFRFTAGDWAAFIQGVKTDEFDN
ncbi:DUF397 domain-containing protein [Actinacidiphila oryziradicis]|uniref:DUF397 domain-containing protein n=1 Tax=Actinacidiphila oryziradicis TaxID=2571141 RepID=A0A4U0RTV6_9ACTN|nr:DUF397 domain-containing protein [Actinacidiphila oryziradicis]TJZ99601.1 DUF397 domain-containing protein [Actinacidiphila oryziradicis]